MEKIKEKSTFEYFKNVIHNTIRLNYTMQTRVLNSSLISLKKSRRLLSRLDMDKSKKLQINSNNNNNAKKPKFYNYELHAHIKLGSLDNSISWKLDSCWLDDNLCSNQIESNSLGGNEGNIGGDGNLGAGSIGSGSEEFAVEIEDYEDEYGDDLDENTSRNNRFSRLINYNQLNLVNFDVKSWHSWFQLAQGYYFFHANMSLYLGNFINLNKKKYILCNLRPYPTCTNYSLLEPSSSHKSVSDKCF